MSRRVLIVEDDIAIREMLSAYFVGRGWQVVAVSNASAAREQLQILALEGMIVDLRLPDADDASLARLGRERGLAVVAVTAFPTANDIIQLYQCGVFSVLSKPFRLKEVLERMEEGIHQEQQNRQIHRDRQVLRLLESLIQADHPLQVEAIAAALEPQAEQVDIERAAVWRQAVMQARERVCRP